MIWPHGQQTLQEFLHLNGIHGNIKLTKELEQNGTLPFLDVLVKKKTDGTLGHTVYRKTTNTDIYLHKDLEHHLEQKRAVLYTLIHRAGSICDEDSLQDEFNTYRNPSKTMAIAGETLRTLYTPATSH
jgi:hypothetical protein